VIYLDPLITSEEIRAFHMNDLLLLIALTDAMMFQRPLTENEVHNFWLAVDERQQRLIRAAHSIFQS
jgi:hypothetical protein